MDDYAPPPTGAQLQALSAALGADVSYGYRIEGGLGGTIDVLTAGDRKVVLRRFWLPEPGEVSPAESEDRALALAARNGIPAPEPIWVDRQDLFPERGIVISFVDGEVNLRPEDPLDWAAQLAAVLADIHRIVPDEKDAEIFPAIDDDDGHVYFDSVVEHRLGSAVLEARSVRKAEMVDAERTYVHHDFWPGNTLWIGERLNAVIDWEGGAVGDPALDIAYCSFDMRMLGLEDAADHFVATYKDVTGRDLPNFEFWYLSALCRPMPDIAMWIPSWHHAGVEITPNEARRRHEELIRRALG
jgi:aminoglycoside phosphotransferase (APT) family kinase protein